MLVRCILGALLAAFCATAAAPGFARARSAQQHLLFGVHLPDAPAAGLTPVDQLQRRLGRPIGVVLWYQQWQGAEPSPRVDWLRDAVASGRLPLVTWEPWQPPADATPGSNTAVQPAFTLTRIVDGAYDDYVRSWARALAAYGGPVYLRPMHEMNGDWYPWGGTVNGNSPATFVAAWRHLHDIFTAVGATNVRWVWSPYAVDVPDVASNRFELYYPGRRYVDVLALDGYNWGKGNGGWRTPAQLFASALARIAELGPQPIWIAETACASTGGSKPQWIRELFALAAAHPRLDALVWFNVDKERDWRADASRADARAFALHG
jgi:beta-mannanase